MLRSMRKMACLAVATLAYSACLYDVEDVSPGSPDQGLGGHAEASDVSVGGWATGGAGGTPSEAANDSTPTETGSDAQEAGKDAAMDVSADATDAAAADATADVVVVPWSSCKDLGYYGACFGGNTVLFFGDAGCSASIPVQCWVNNCNLKNGQCTKSGSGSCGGWGCSNQLDPGQGEDCTNWNTGKCRDNVVIKADPASGKNCLYKNCTALGKTCQTDAGVPSDCY